MRKLPSEMYYAERFFEIDSFNLALNGYGTYPGFLNVIDDYGIPNQQRWPGIMQVFVITSWVITKKP